jgi:hypothetical protein
LKASAQGMKQLIKLKGSLKNGRTINAFCARKCFLSLAFDFFFSTWYLILGFILD